MASYQLSCFLLFCFYVLAEGFNDDILQRIAKLEELQFGCSLKNNVLEEKERNLEEKVKILEERNDITEKHLENTLKALEEKDESLTRVITELISSQAALPSIHRRQTGAGHVAFSASLAQDVDNLGPDQVIVFNQVQLNDGNAYSAATGAFTVPIDGVYVFTFFVAQRNSNQIYVKLVVNGVDKSQAVAETVQSAHDAQGGNVVVLRVNTGDAVAIEHNTWGTHIEGDKKLTTFSGFLLYSLVGEVSVIGK